MILRMIDEEDLSRNPEKYGFIRCPGCEEVLITPDLVLCTDCDETCIETQLELALPSAEFP